MYAERNEGKKNRKLIEKKLTKTWKWLFKKVSNTQWKYFFDIESFMKQKKTYSTSETKMLLF